MQKIALIKMIPQTCKTVNKHVEISGENSAILSCTMAEFEVYVEGRKIYSGYGTYRQAIAYCNDNNYVARKI